MGEGHARSRATLQRVRAEEKIRESSARRASAERQRQQLTSLLGTEEQLEADQVTSQELPYIGRYQVDIDSLGPLASTQYFGPSSTARLTEDSANQLASEANKILEQAQQAAAQGDFQEADRLKAEAQARLGTLHGAVEVGGTQYSAAPFAFNLIEDPRQAALVRATSTEGRIVGRRLQQALDLQDEEGEEFTRRRSLLFDPFEEVVDEGVTQANRAIAAERRATEAQLRREGGAALGGTGRRVQAERAARRATSDAAALARANVFSTAAQDKARALLQVNTYLLDFADRFSRESVALAQQWVSGTAGVRDRFQESLISLDLTQSELAFQSFQIYQREYMAKRGTRLEKQGARRGLLTSALATLGGGAIGFALGGPAGALIGGQIGGQITGRGGGPSTGGIGSLSSLLGGGGASGGSGGGASGGSGGKALGKVAPAGGL